MSDSATVLLVGFLVFIVVGGIGSLVTMGDYDSKQTMQKYERVCASRHQTLWRSTNDVWCLDPVTRAITLPVE